MVALKLRNGRVIGDGQLPYVIAELNSSHNGNIETAKQMIAAAKECGCDCVKFQSWSSESLYADEYYEANPISKRIVSKFSLNSEQLVELAEYCQKVGIDFSSTPYSNQEVDFLAERTNAPFIKIASMEINNFPFLKYIAAKGLPIVLSTGMSTIEEIRQAVEAIEETGNRKLCILHCVSVYPASSEIINLRNITMLKRLFPHYVIGYSDHTIGSEVAAASVALGAGLIEKHFTLDNKKMGMDNNMATEPPEMKALVEACRSVYEALGSEERILLQGEKEQQLKMRRSLVSARSISSGEILTADDIVAKRPGDGIPPDCVERLVGRKVNTDIPKGHLFRKEFFDEK